jgi:HEAT repeat protein
MMLIIRSVASVLAAVSILDTARLEAQPTIPRRRIPADLPAEVSHQVQRLYSSDPDERISPAAELGNMGDGAVSAIPVLIATLHDTHKGTGGSAGEVVGSAVAEALGKIGEPAVEPLNLFFQDTLQDAAARYYAASALAATRNRKAWECLAAALQSENIRSQKAAVAALAAAKAPETLGPLLAGVKTIDELVWYDALSALSRARDPQTVEYLITALRARDRDLEIRHFAASALGCVRDARMAKLLVTALKAKEGDVRGLLAKSFDGIEKSRRVVWHQRSPIDNPVA